MPARNPKTLRQTGDRDGLKRIIGTRHVRGPTGIRQGKKVSDYRRFAVRLPDDVRAELEAAAGALKRPGWRVVIDAIRAYVGTGPGLSEDERRVIRAVVKLHGN